MGCWWAALEWFEQQGYHFDWRICEPAKIGLNVLCDRMSQLASVHQQSLTLDQVSPGLSVNNVNPYEPRE